MKVDYFDDGDSEAAATQDATQLITSDHVLALMDNSSTAAPYAALAAQDHVPMISMTGDHNANDYVTDPNAFAEGTTVPSELWAYAEAANLSNRKNLALLYCSNVAACAHWSRLSKRIRLNRSPRRLLSGVCATAPNFTAICLAAKEANANSIEPVGPVVAANFRVLQNCRAQGYNPLPIMSGTNFGTGQYIASNGVTNLWGYQLASLLREGFSHKDVRQRYGQLPAKGHFGSGRVGRLGRAADIRDGSRQDPSVLDGDHHGYLQRPVRASRPDHRWSDRFAGLCRQANPN